MQIQDDPSLRWPNIIRSNLDNRAENLFYCFHIDDDHLTKDCIGLKEQIETLIRQGKLQKFVGRDRLDNRSSKHQDPKGQTENCRPGPIGEIIIIIGSPASRGTSRASRKAYAWQIHNILVIQ
jgi:hypothetical protein